jgi:DNA invertase Pin-like site-specific DNA recombinase
MAIFAYARVSRSDQTTENQRIEIEGAGYAVDYWYADEGVSGKVSAMQRPQFSKMLGQMRDGEKLVVTKLDRLGRDAQDVGATIKHLKERKIEVVVLQVGKLDLTSPAGKMMLTMLAAVSEMERDLLIERTHAGLERAKAEGKRLGRTPKTTPEQREKIKTAYNGGKGESVSALARDNKISRATVLSIVNAA